MNRFLAIFPSIVFFANAYSPPHQQYRIADNKTHTINNVQFSIANYGTFGTGSPYGPGCFWPIGTDHNYIWGAGILFGSIIGNDTLVSAGYAYYNYHEFVPGIVGMEVDDPDARIFIYPEYWPPSAIYETAPEQSLSDQDSWCAFNDTDSSAHVPGDTRPIGIEVYQSVHVWNLEIVKDVVFLKYVFKNVSNADLGSCYFGIFADNDIGSEYGHNSNDIISGVLGRWYVISGQVKYVNDIGYQWQEEIEPSWDEYPGLIAYDLLQTPWDLVENQDKDYDDIPDQYERDSSYYVNNLPQSKWDVDFDLQPDWRDPSEIPQIGMTAFKDFVFTYEARTDRERYLSMCGYNFKTGAYQPYDTIPSYPGDHRFLISTGPFNLQRDSTMTIVFAIMFSNWHDQYQTPDTAMVNIDYTTQYVFDMNWLLPGPPPPPNLICIPGDASITLIWDKSSELQPDDYYNLVCNPQSPYYDPFYRQYDFEGYGVWRSLSGEIDDWQLLGRFDLANNIIFEDTIAAESIRIYARDTGLVHSFIDENLRNGFRYFYAVSAYDYNLVKENDSTVRSIWFESNIIPVSAVPRRDPVNYVAGNYAITQDFGNPLLADSNINVAITYPLDMTNDPLYIDFGEILYDTVWQGPCYRAYLKNAVESVLDSFTQVVDIGDESRHEFVYQNGLSIAVILSRPEIPTNVSIFDRVEQQSGTYPVDSLVAPVAMATNWAYRGNDYQITWIAAYGSDSANSVIVEDIQSGVIIPYSQSAMDGWCFRSISQQTDTLVYAAAANLGTRTIYINGGRFKLTNNWMSPGDEPRPAVGEVWIVHRSGLYHPAPQGARLTVTPTPASMRTDTTFTLNVKVVPNPYLVRNEWQQTFAQRRIRFINLPSECTIRIFTINGDLVRTIRHHHTLAVNEGETPIPNSAGGDEWWNLLSQTNHLVTSGIYIFHVQSPIGEQVGKLVIIH